jgi:hypothetical protein
MIKLKDLLLESNIEEDFLSSVNPHKRGEWVDIGNEPIRTRIKKRR